MALRDRVLANQRWYHAFKQALRADTTMRTMVVDHIRPQTGDRVLDVGCGDGDIRRLLGEVDYTGVDTNENYLRVARGLEDRSTRFVSANVTDLARLGFSEFDLAIAVGLLHHLSDEESDNLLSGLSKVLRQGGRLITLDPVFTPDQRTIARVLAALDRGRHVREAKGYCGLVESHFAVRSVVTRHDLIWFPYSHCIIESESLPANT
jgi:ubiquinone/menaquinone biosynthesis C-methylase UbiE